MKSPRVAPVRGGVAALIAIALIATLAGSAVAAPGGQGKAGFRTSIQAMLKPGADAPAGVVIDPLLTVGDELDDGFVFDSIPDGISLIRHGQGTVELFVNHETSLVPFPIVTNADGSVTRFDDFTNSHVDRLVINQHSAGAVDAEDAIPSDANYQRFCSNFLAGAEQGFDRRILFTNEEASDLVYRTGLAWPVNEPADPRDPEQAGVVVALDVETGEFRSIYGMGRHNHENSVAIPGYDDLVVLSSDDTFSAPASQLYSYVAEDTDAVWNDTGALYAFKSADPLTNDYGDLTSGETVAGTFIPVPEAIAKGDQTGLENWSNANDVFQFIRVEDIAYDRNDPHVVYFADTGEPRANNATSAGAGRLTRAGSTFQGPFPNGRIFKMVLNDANPLVVDRLSVLIDADAGGYNNPAVIHQPDNLETTATSLLIQEDPGGHNQFALTNPAGVGARVWRYDLTDPTDPALEAVLEVDQSLDETPGYDVDTASAARRGAWESSGIIDASSVWGEGWFLIDVQAGSLILESTAGTLGGVSVQFEREGGQLLRVKIPGA
jgi:hypothetical protein